MAERRSITRTLRLRWFMHRARSMPLRITRLHRSMRLFTHRRGLIIRRLPITAGITGTGTITIKAGAK